MYKKYLIIALIIISITSAVIYWQLSSQNEVHVTFLDVGQGDAIHIRDGSFDVLIDGGGDEKVMEKISEQMPFFDRVLELVILTHPHADHLNGLISILERYKVKTVIETGVNCQTESCLSWDQIIKEKGITRLGPHEIQNIIMEHSELEILYPLQDYSKKKIDNLNNSSIVSCFSYKDQAILLTGDAEMEVEEELLLENGKFGKCVNTEILKLGHHGSKSSTSEELLDLIKPEYAIVSAGEDNKFNHPHFVTLEKLKSRQIEIFETAVHGSVAFSFFEDGTSKVEME